MRSGARDRWSPIASHVLGNPAWDGDEAACAELEDLVGIAGMGGMVRIEVGRGGVGSLADQDVAQVPPPGSSHAQMAAAKATSEGLAAIKAMARKLGAQGLAVHVSHKGGRTLWTVGERGSLRESTAHTGWTIGRSGTGWTLVDAVRMASAAFECSRAGGTRRNTVLTGRAMFLRTGFDPAAEWFCGGTDPATRELASFDVGPCLGAPEREERRWNSELATDFTAEARQGRETTDEVLDAIEEALWMR